MSILLKFTVCVFMIGVIWPIGEAHARNLGMLNEVQFKRYVRILIADKVCNYPISLSESGLKAVRKITKKIGKEKYKNAVLPEKAFDSDFENLAKEFTSNNSCEDKEFAEATLQSIINFNKK